MPRILLVDDSASARHFLAAKLREHGYEVEGAPEATTAAEIALTRPPHAIVTDLWMPGISGLQLCRLMRGDPTTIYIPIVLLTASADRRSRFWAGCAGATAYVTKTEIDDLVRILGEVTKNARTFPPPQVSRGEPPRIQERLSQILDASLYDATIAGEVRALAHNAENMERLFADLVKLASDVVTYRWFALTTNDGPPLLHANPMSRDAAEREAREALKCSDAPMTVLADDRAMEGNVTAVAPLVLPVRFGSMVLGTVAFGPTARGASTDDKRLLDLVAAELGGPLRMAALVVDARRLAATDTLTGLMNRRAFLEAIERERSRAERHTLPLSLLLLDVDHFKKVNDTRGHDAGDAVLRGIATILTRIARKSDFVARWGGEEFVLALPQTAEAGARIAAERVRRAIADAACTLPSGDTIHATASIGLASASASFAIDELVGRADRAMYAAKGRGRNRVEVG